VALSLTLLHTEFHSLILSDLNFLYVLSVLNRKYYNKICTSVGTFRKHA